MLIVASISFGYIRKGSFSRWGGWRWDPSFSLLQQKERIVMLGCGVGRVAAANGMIHLQSRGINSVLLVLVKDDLNVSLSTHDDGALSVNGIWHQVDHILDLSLKQTGGRDSTSLLDDHCHGDSFVQQSKLSLGGLVVGGVQVDSSVKDGAVNVGNHGSDISGSIWLFASLERFNGILDGLVPVDGVTLVGGVNSLTAIFWENHLVTGVDELSDGTVQAESVNVTTLEGEDHFDSTGVCNVSSADA